MSTDLRVADARDLGPQFVNNPHRMVGQDGAYSIPLDNRTLWFFGDTLVGERPEGRSLWYIFGEPVGGQDLTGKGPFDQMITNTGLLLREETGREGLNNFSYILNERGNLKQLVPTLSHEHPDKDRIWCMHGCSLNGRIYLYYMKVSMHEKGGHPFPVGFEIVGTGLAAGNAHNWTFERIVHDGETMLWKADDPHFASAVLAEPESKYVYLYGSVQDEHNVHQCYVARVPQGALEDFNSYEYLTADTPSWSKAIVEAAPIFGEMPNEMSVSFNRYLNAYLAVYSEGLTGRIIARTAPNPWGPWSRPVTLWVVEPPHEEPPYPTLIYAGKEHPELAGEEGRVLYLTYIEFEEYFPHLIEVTLT